MSEINKANTCENTDKEIWREKNGDYYSDSIHVTSGGGVGINCGGMVVVAPLKQWHTAINELAELQQAKEADLPFLVWAQSYIDPARWAGHRLDDAIKTELLERDNEVVTLRQERDELQQVVSALAYGWTFVDDWHSRVVDSLCKDKFEEAKEMAIVQYPCLQGHRNQMNVIAIGRRKFDSKLAGKKIAALAAQQGADTVTTNPQPCGESQTRNECTPLE